MPTGKRPGVYFDETTEYELEGNGGKIPVVIGVTGLHTSQHPIDGTGYLKYKSYDEACRNVTQGGIGTHVDENPVLAFLKDFFEEAEPKTSEDIGIPYVYVIDVGEGTSKTAWLNALTTAKTLRDATVEVYVKPEAITDEGYTITDFINAAHASIASETSNLNIRNGFFTKQGATDSQLIALNPTSGGILKSRIGLVEPDKFGKIVALLCCTPYYIEPGFLPFRTVQVGEFTQRTDAEIVALQEAGVIIGADEIVSDLAVARMNLAVSTAYAASPRPADSLFHARFNADHLLREVFKAIFTQVKANETVSYIVKAQTKVDAVIDAEVEAERMIPFNSETGDGTRLTLVEADSNPFDMKLKGQIQGINCTHTINVEILIKNPKTVSA